MRKGVWIALAVAVVLGGGYVVVQPWLAGRALEQALAQHNPDQLRELVDFQQVAIALEDDLPSYFRRHSQVDPDSTDFAVDFASSLGKGFAAEVATPAGLEELVAPTADRSVLFKHRYISAARFSSATQASNGTPLEFIWQRRGLSWRVTRINGVLEFHFPVGHQASQTKAPPESEDESTNTVAGEDLPSEGIEIVSSEPTLSNRVGGEVTCIDKTSFRPICVETGEVEEAGEGNLILTVRTTVRNNSERAQSLSVVGMNVSYNGKKFQYDFDDPAERVEPLNEAVIVTTVKSPVDVFESGEFELIFSNGLKKPLSVQKPSEFDAQNAMTACVAEKNSADGRLDRSQLDCEAYRSTAEYEEAVRQLIAERDAEKKASEARDKALIERCHGSKGDDEVPLTEGQYEWYLENCGSMYNVDDYPTYLKMRAARLSG